jgi:luciferase family oxidoreductase group 1
VSALELGGRLPETPAEQAVQDMAASARTADVCGYHRLWVAEHHSSTKTASSFPAVLIAHLAAQTRRVRLGSGGVMLPNHAPFSVAEQFATLQALHPGRIDLGLGRSSGGGVGTHKLLAEALRRSPTAISEFPALIDELLGFLHHRGPDGNRFHDLPLTPHTATPPQVHVLGAGENSARIAAERGLPFAYGHHLGRSKCRPEAAARYRSAFRPGPDGARPYLIVSVNVICGENDEEAEELAVRTATTRVLHPEEPVETGTPSPVRRQYLARKALEDLQVVYGGPATVAARLDALAAELDADEIMVVPYELSGPERLRTLRLAATALTTAERAGAAPRPRSGGTLAGTARV